jgi:hypothetical protein
MQVPFISSGALSRVHYSLVRKVELAQTTQQADGYLLDQVVAVRERLSRPGFSSVGSALLLSRKGSSLNIPDCLGPVSRMSYPLAILFPERSSWTSSWRARIRAHPRCQSGRGGYLYRGTKNWYVVYWSLYTWFATASSQDTYFAPR